MFKENFINDDGFQIFCHTSLDALNKHSPCRKKHARDNQMPYFNKKLLKAIMTQAKLQNIFLQNKSEENRIPDTKLRNFCVYPLRKTKKRYNENLNEKSVADNKLFWKTVKPLLSVKVDCKDKIHLIENNELVKTDLKTAEVLNKFFSNIAQNLDISGYSNDESLASNTNNATSNVIYGNHSSIIAVQNKCKDKGCFNFIEVDQKQIEKEILKLGVNKASQGPDMLIKVLKENTNIFSTFLCNSFTNFVK